MEQEYFESHYPETARATEMAKLAEYIKEGASCQLISLPGAGRATILGLLAHNKKIQLKHFGDTSLATHFVTINFSEIRKRPLFDVTKFFFLALSDSLRERTMHEAHTKIEALFKESLSFNDELVLFQALKEAIDYLCLEKKLLIVFLFDRFEEYIPTVTSAFFTNLRTLRNRAKYHFVVVFSLPRPLEMLIEPTTLSDFYEFVAGHTVYLKLSDPVTTNFRISSIEEITGKKLTKGDLETITRLTGGFGKLTKLAAEAVLAYGKTEKNLETFLLGQKPIIATLQEIWFSLSPAEQTALVQSKTQDHPYLEDVGLVQGKTLQIPLLDRFIHTEISHQTEKGHIIYDENTNAIKKGEDLLSDQLTSSEFRLLRYLLQEQGRVVERDELINAVWQDQKSTAGITDQAVDQLIFRLRRKIEEDPNSPLHLQTVKGRGFKFVA